ncbi:MAG: pyridoxamine 5'-phosphate oxidase family protein [Oscillospiraceae bacterium]
MEKLTAQTENIMNERFGKDNVIALATSENNIPYVRGVNAFYEDGAFYVITYALSDKMKQLEKNPTAALSGEWFTAHGTAENIGWFRKPENAPLAAKLRGAFSDWIDNGHNNFEDENVIILKIKLTRGVLFSDGIRYEIDFTL